MTFYATGRKAKAVCDRCGLWGSYLEMFTEAETGLRVHQQCLDEPYIFRKRPPEGIALRHPRPDTDLAEPWPGFEIDPEIYSPEPGHTIPPEDWGVTLFDDAGHPLTDEGDNELLQEP